MRTAPILAAVAVAAAAVPALAGTVTQTINYDWDGFGDWQVGTFDAFDSAGGSRELTGVSIGINASAQWDVTALNYSATAFEPGDWFANGLTNFNVLLGEFGPGGIERIAGVVEFNGLTGSLGAGSGDIFGEPGDPAVSGSFSGFISNFFDLEAGEFGAFTGAPVEARLLSFSDVTVDGPNGPPGIINVNTDLLVSSGSMTLTYQYRVIPAPAGLALLGVLVPAAARRRR